jgi:hypothetical protein
MPKPSAICAATEPISGSDDADCLADEVEAEQPFKREVALANPVVCARNFADDREDQCERMLRHRMRRVRRNTANRDSMLGRCSEIDDRRGVRLITGEDTYCRRTFREGGGRHGEAAVQIT